MEYWWEETRWLRRHALLAPFGVFAATLLVAWYMEHWQWHGRSSWELAVTLVDMGAVLYGMAAVMAERSSKLMFWAWQQHQKWRAQMREEGRAEGREQGREKGLEQGLEQGRKESAAQIRELQEANRQLQARLSELEARNGSVGR